ncbi:hypothetical protein M9H77_12223 [Catharanthus roseus]|uniref:Uncharacterized protein n=1 Tax=Catharanthus roseus TaxID=4058 RepID=A0ACC0BGW7_CATRO|nr:hypothetical protein M9H77_12223 [Catharanthus roseus]
MLNYTEHPSKSSHAQPNENSIDVIAGTINADQRFGHELVKNSGRKWMHTVLSFFTELVETYFGTCFVKYVRGMCDESVGDNIDGSSETIYVIAVTCSGMFMVFVSWLIETVCGD